MNRPILSALLSSAFLSLALAGCSSGALPDAGTADVPTTDARTTDVSVPDPMDVSAPDASSDVAASDTAPPDVPCSSGQTACASGATSACVDLATDPMNCGACGMACQSGQVCARSSCQCSGSRVACAGACVDTMTDPANCGSCGRACPAGQACTGGTCACPAPLEACGSECVRTMTDPANCGSCGNACRATESCSAGVCNSLCAVGTTSCGGRCVNPLTDAANCGSCGNECGAARSCTAGACIPRNDTRATATPITLMTGETTVTGHTGGATHDGPTVDCTCTSGADVWFRFELAAEEIVYVDTAGSTFDTSLLITDGAGAPIGAQASLGSPGRGVCNDDAGCPASSDGFTATTQSRTWAWLSAGTWFVVVGGCGSGAFTLHVQHLRRDAALPGFIAPGVGGISGELPIRNATNGSCGGAGAASTGEQMRVFTTCARAPQLFSLCASDGGTYDRRQLASDFDPVLYIRSGASGAELACNDDGMTMGALDCRGTGGDMDQLGSRLNDVNVPRGLHAVYVDSRTGGDATFAAMDYTMRYAVRSAP